MISAPEPPTVALVTAVDVAADALRPAADLLCEFGVRVVEVEGASPERAATLPTTAIKEGWCAVIVASTDGVLPAAVADALPLPVVRVPAAGEAKNGLALLQTADGDLPAADREGGVLRHRGHRSGGSQERRAVRRFRAGAGGRPPAGILGNVPRPADGGGPPTAASNTGGTACRPPVMDTLLLAADAEGAVGQAALRLAAGELVALPTETVYGLAADAARPEAVAAIFQAKERPFFDPLIVHLPGPDWLERLTQPSVAERGLVARLTAAFWPGPLTILLPRRPDAVPDLVTAGSPLVAVRMSAHPVFAAVLREFGRPVAAPSANRFGRISPTTGEHVRRELDGRVPLILDAGPTAHGLESTVVLLEGADRLRILRPGPVTAEMLTAHVQVVTIQPSGNASAPGQLPGHYAPRTPLHFYQAGRVGPGRVGLLAFRADDLPASGDFAASGSVE